jgi:hypothetical protein
MERKASSAGLNGSQTFVAAKKRSLFADLRSRESGRLKPRVHAHNVVDRDLRSIDLSNNREIKSRHSQPIYALDVDLVECR